MIKHSSTTAVARGAPKEAAFKQTLLVLVGLPGSGKSTLAAALTTRGGWTCVSQDEYGSRSACEMAVAAALATNRNVVVDRCNVDVAQRRVWIDIAARFSGTRCCALYVAANRIDCERRVVARADHRLPASAALRVVHALASAISEPDEEEGFAVVLAAPQSPGLTDYVCSQLGIAAVAASAAAATSASAASLVASAAGAERVLQPGTLAQLEAWLRASFPRDVLIPCPAGEKRPGVPYKGGQWTWAGYDALDKTALRDWAIQLRDLCVVDVDSGPLAELLEAKHPALAAAPCARTRRGCHYYFRRPAAADALGYWDGSGQRGACVDFKSVCANGTSGIILAPPSTDKAWVRPPWDAASPVCAMPLTLLDAVARPRGPAAPAAASGAAPSAHSAAALAGAGAAAAVAKGAPITLTFTDAAGGGGGGSAGAASGGAPETLALPDSAVLRPFGFFDAVTSGRWPAAKVPCDRATFELLLSVAQRGELPLEVPPTPALLGRLEGLADMLVASAAARRAVHVPSLSRLTFHADLWALCPDWWRVNAEEESAVRAAASADASLVPVNVALASQLVCAPLAPKDGRWLLPDLQPRAAAAAGAPVLVADPAAALSAALPRALLPILARFSDRLVAAGGGVLADWDLFVHSTDGAGANAVLAAMKAALGATHDVSATKGAVTFIPRHAAMPAPWERVYGMGAACPEKPCNQWDDDGWWLPGGHPQGLAYYGQAPPPPPTDAAPGWFAAAAEAAAAAAAAAASSSSSSAAATTNAAAAAATSAAAPRPVSLQLVRCLYRDRAQVLQSFDLAPCKVLARAVPAATAAAAPVAGAAASAAAAAAPAFFVEALPSWVEALRRKAFWVDTAVWGTASPSRVLKYVAKGFEAALPGLRRDAIEHALTGDIRKGDASLRALLEAEVAVRSGFYRHAARWPPRPLPAKKAAAAAAGEEEDDDEAPGGDDEGGCGVVSFDGQVFCFTGFRDAGLEAAIKGAGGSVAASMTKAVTAIVALPSAIAAQTGKVKAAAERGLSVYTAADVYAQLAVRPAARSAAAAKRGSNDGDGDGEDGGDGDGGGGDGGGGDGEGEEGDEDEDEQERGPAHGGRAAGDNAPLSPAEAQTIADVLNGAVRTYVLRGGYCARGRGGYAFVGSGGSECSEPNDPDVLIDDSSGSGVLAGPRVVLVDDAAGCATVAGPRFQQSDPCIDTLHSARRLFLVKQEAATAAADDASFGAATAAAAASSLPAVASASVTAVPASVPAAAVGKAAAPAAGRKRGAAAVAAVSAAAATIADADAPRNDEAEVPAPAKRARRGADSAVAAAFPATAAVPGVAVAPAAATAGKRGAKSKPAGAAMPATAAAAGAGATAGKEEDCAGDGSATAVAASTAASGAASFAGQVFCFTGFRDAGLEAAIKGAGGSVAASMTKAVTAIVALPSAIAAQTGKVKAAADRGLSLYTADDVYAQLAVRPAARSAAAKA